MLAPLLTRPPREALGLFIRGEKPLLGAGGAAVIAGGSDDAKAGFGGAGIDTAMFLKRATDAGNDVVKGDIVEFKQDVFGGSFKRPTYLGQRTVHGEVLRESYGADKQQHTFTIKPLNVEGVNADELLKKDSFRIKGRNLYKNGVLREMFDDEAARKLVADEKHERGAAAREARDIRKGMAGVGGAAVTIGTAGLPQQAEAGALNDPNERQSSVSRFFNTLQDTIGGTRGMVDMGLMTLATVPNPLQIPALATEGALLARDAVNFVRENPGALSSRASSGGQMRRAR